MRRLAATTAALVIALGAGCGADDEGEPIPRQNARALLDVLALIERQVDSGACNGAQAKVRNDLRPKVEQLPDEVDPDVRSALEDGVDRLLPLIEDQCGLDEEPTETTETTPPETETEPTETTPPPTETTPPPTETTPPDTAPPGNETPPDQDTPPNQDTPPDQDGQPGNGGNPGAGNDGGAEAPEAGGGRRTAGRAR